MLSINILIQVLTLIGICNVVSSETSTKIAKIIESQTELCSYVSLCSSINTTVSVKPLYSIPCCRECFCDENCQVRGDCCPDYSSATHNVTSPHNELESSSNKTESTNNSYIGVTGLNCIRSHYGLFKNDGGYKMVASCPHNFTRNATKIRCETPFDYLNTNFYDHIPISDINSGLTFKNRFCKSCFFSTVGSFEFWEVWLVCTGDFYFPYFNLTNPFDLFEKIFRSKGRVCSIVFKPINISPEQCMREEVIDTCLAGGSWDADLQDVCNEYTWPIMAQNGLKLDTYKNYACLLCNEISFQETCRRKTDYLSPLVFTASLNVDLSTTHMQPQYQNEMDEISKTSRHQLIQRSFTDPDENCPDGFVYDKTRNTCRQVLCPIRFYINYGSCIPMFRVIKGVFYRVILELLLPYSLNGAEAENVETDLFSSLNDTFLQRLGKGNYDFSLWRNSKSRKAITWGVTYVLYLTVNWQFANGNYLAFLEFVHQLVLSERQFPISILMKESTVNVNVGLKFGTSVVQYNNMHRLRYIRNFETLEQEDLHLILPSGWKESFGQIISAMDVTKLSFCHTVILSQAEFRKFRSAYIEVLKSKRILLQPYFQVMLKDAEEWASVCINDAFLDTDERSSYVFNTTDLDLLTYQWPAKTINKIKTEEDDIKSDTLDINDNEINDTTDSKSLVAVICSFALLIAIVSVRVVLKRLIKRAQNFDETESADGGCVENIQMSDINGAEQRRHDDVEYDSY